MKIIDLVQGSAEWKAHRLNSRNASEAGMVMGVHPNVRRGELLAMKASGLEQEFSAWFEKNVLDRGHAVEELARPMAEEIVGEDLFPVTATSDDSFLSASYDGQTMDESINWECKQWNETKASMVREGKVPEADLWQVMQGLAVNPGSRTLYMVTDGTPENCVHIWVDHDAGQVKRLISAWQQFDEDLANYTPTHTAEKPVAAATQDLPAVSVRVEGSLSVIDNFDRFESALTHFVGEILIRDPQTDQDFADLEAQVKALKKAEEALDQAESQLLSQVESVDTAKKRKDMLHKMARDNRLMAEKLVTEQKKAIKLQIAQDGRKAVDEHIAKLNAGLDGAALPQITTDFNGAMKAKRTIATLRDAADNEVARAKIEATETAELIRGNLKALAEAGHEFLFADRQQLVTKQSDDLLAVIKSRIADHEAKEKQRLEAERERIRAEEQAKVEAEVQRKAEQERAEREAEARRKANEARADAEGAGTFPIPSHARVRDDLAPDQDAPEYEHKPLPAPREHEVIRLVAISHNVSDEQAETWLAGMTFRVREVA